MKKKIFCLVLALVLCASLLCACGNDTPVPSGHLRLKGRDVAVDWVVKVDGHEISADEYRYFFMNIVYGYTSDSEEEHKWTDGENEAVLSSALEYIILNRAMYDLAERCGITVDENDLADIDKTVAEMKAQYGEEGFIEVLDSNYITPEYYPELLKSTVIQEKLSEYLTGSDGEFYLTEAEMVDIVCSDYVCVRYLMLGLDEEGSTENRDRIAGYAAAIETKDDLITHINIYSEAVTMKNNPEGRYLALGQDKDQLYLAAQELEIGEISPVVECDDGYYIILRQPIDVDFVTENADSFISLYQEKMIGQLLIEESEDTVIDLNSDIYDRISVKTMK